jgi:hypothetical protein
MIIYKFRAWDKNRRELCKVSSIELNDNGIFWIEVINSDNVLRRLYPKQYEINQYIGINDNSNNQINDAELEDKEIYLHDIIKFCYKGITYTGIVKVGIGSFIVVADELPDGYININKITTTDGDYSWINGIVVGNTYKYMTN